MKVRFQADADLNQIIVKAILRKEPAIDFKTTTEAKLEGQNDIDVLKIATQEDRVLVSHDQRTMPSHFATYIIDKASSGVILVSKVLESFWFPKFWSHFGFQKDVDCGGR